MTHTSEPMTLADVSRKLNDFANYPDDESPMRGELQALADAIDAELAKQREAEPVALKIAADISTRDEFKHVESPLVLRIVDETIKSFGIRLSKLSHIDAIAYCDPSDPFNSTAFAWPGTARDISRHTEPLYTHPQQRNAVEVTDEREAFENWFSQSHKWTVLRSEHTGNYPDNRMQEAWSGWKARAALSPVASRDKEDAEQWRQKLRGYADRIERAEPYLRNQSITRWVKDITDDLKRDADNA